MDVVALIAGALSIAVAIIAIFLSCKYNKESKQTHDEINNVLDEIKKETIGITWISQKNNELIMNFVSKYAEINATSYELSTGAISPQDAYKSIKVDIDSITASTTAFKANLDLYVTGEIPFTIEPKTAVADSNLQSSTGIKGSED